MPDSSAEPKVRERRRRGIDPEVTSRAEEGLRIALDESAAGSRAAAALSEATLELQALDPELAPGSIAALSRPGLELGPLRRKKRFSPAYWSAMAWLGLVVFGALFANVLPLDNPNEPSVGPIDQGPTWQHLFGTDQIGHDIFSQVVYAARDSLLIGVTSVIVGLAIGGGFGVMAGFYRGWIDIGVVWVVDVLLTLPGLILALTLVAFLGPTLINVIIAIDLLSIPAYARIARATSLAVSQREFVLSALSLGAKPRRILFRDIIPLVSLPIASFAAIGMSIAILAAAGLAFLGVGPPNALSWGTLIANGQGELQTAPQLVLFPSIVLFLTVLSLNFLGQRASAALDPRQGQL